MQSQRRRYLIIEDIRDSKESAGSYAVLGTVELNVAHIKGIEAITLDEQTASGFREIMRKYGAMAEAKG